MEYKIYKITNNLNNKSYIGITKQSINTRLKQHLKANSIIGNIIRNNPYTIKEIHNYQTNDSKFIKEKESNLIITNNTLYPYGYNDSLSYSYKESYNIHDISDNIIEGINTDSYKTFYFEVYKEIDKTSLFYHNNIYNSLYKYNTRDLIRLGVIRYKNNKTYVLVNTIKSFNLYHILECRNKIIKKYNLNNKLNNSEIVLTNKPISFRINFNEFELYI